MGAETVGGREEKTTTFGTQKDITGNKTNKYKMTFYIFFLDCIKAETAKQHFNDSRLFNRTMSRKWCDVDFVGRCMERK